jgi:hypothetical protein
MLENPHCVVNELFGQLAQCFVDRNNHFWTSHENAKRPGFVKLTPRLQTARPLTEHEKILVCERWQDWFHLFDTRFMRTFPWLRNVHRSDSSKFPDIDWISRNYWLYSFMNCLSVNPSRILTSPSRAFSYPLWIRSSASPSLLVGYPIAQIEISQTDQASQLEKAIIWNDSWERQSTKTRQRGEIREKKNELGVGFAREWLFDIVDEMNMSMQDVQSHAEDIIAGEPEHSIPPRQRKRVLPFGGD